jgi:hypothetical protein
MGARNGPKGTQVAPQLIRSAPGSIFALLFLEIRVNSRCAGFSIVEEGFTPLEQFSKRMVPLIETRRVLSLLYSLNAEGSFLVKVHPFREKL